MKKIFLILLLLASPAWAQDSKLTELDAITPTGDDLIYVVDDPGGTPASKKATVSATVGAANAATATALAADGGNCDAGFADRGVSASGVAQDCFDVATQVELDAHTGSAAAHAAGIAGNAATATSASTASALGADGTDCDAGEAARGVDAAGNAELCFDAATQVELDAHINDTTAAHAATAISVSSTNLSSGTSTNAQAVFEELEDYIDAHINDSSAAHAASAISVDSTTLVGTGTTVQAVFEELDDAIAALGGDVLTQSEANGIDFIVGTATGTISGERVCTDTNTIDCDMGTAAQAKFNVQSDSIGPTQIDETANFAFSADLFPEVALADLPVPGTARRFRWVTDCETETACDIGLGTISTLHYDDGENWIAIRPADPVGTPTFEAVIGAGNTATNAEGPDNYVCAGSATSQFCFGNDPSTGPHAGGRIDGVDVYPWKYITLPTTAADVDGAQCTSSATAINSGPSRTYVKCTDNGAGIIYFTVDMPTHFTGEMEVSRVEINANATPGNDTGMDVSAYCAGDKDTHNNTAWGSAVAVDINYASGYVQYDHGYSAWVAMTPGGTCTGGNKTLEIRMVVDATATDETVTNIYHKTLRLRYRTTSSAEKLS